jgi:hypothetical protein
MMIPWKSQGEMALYDHLVTADPHRVQEIPGKHERREKNLRDENGGPKMRKRR